MQEGLAGSGPHNAARPVEERELARRTWCAEEGTPVDSPRDPHPQILGHRGKHVDRFRRAIVRTARLLVRRLDDQRGPRDIRNVCLGHTSDRSTPLEPNTVIGRDHEHGVVVGAHCFESCHHLPDEGIRRLDLEQVAHAREICHLLVGPVLTVQPVGVARKDCVVLSRRQVVPREMREEDVQEIERRLRTGAE